MNGTTADKLLYTKNGVTDAWKAVEEMGVIIPEIRDIALLGDSIRTIENDKTFSPTDILWFHKNTGLSDISAEFIEDTVTSTMRNITTNTLYKDKILLDGSGTKNARINVSAGSHSLTMENCHIQPWVTTAISEDFFHKLKITHCENKSPLSRLLPSEIWEEVLPDQNAFSQGSIDISYSRINSLLDGIVPRNGTVEYPINIYRNWIRGPGKVIGDRHMDGIQLISGGFINIIGNRIEGWDNNAIFIMGDYQSKDETDNPIQHVVIKNNFFGSVGLRWYFLSIRESSTNQDTYGRRPWFVTITENYFESKYGGIVLDRQLSPIATGDDPNAGTFKVAMFVRSEAEREEGIEKQNNVPEILTFRQTLGYDRNAVDARSWIVWDKNYWADNNTEAAPDSGWYDLTQERNYIPEPIPQVTLTNMLKNPEFITTSNWASNMAGRTLSANDGILTTTGNAGQTGSGLTVLQNDSMPYILGHKIYVRLTTRTDAGNDENFEGRSIQFGSSSATLFNKVKTTEWVTVSGILEVKADQITNPYFGMITYFVVTQSLEGVSAMYTKPMCIDITGTDVEFMPKEWFDNIEFFSESKTVSI